MNHHDITARRLYNQQISASRCTSPLEVVSWLGAMQAQDYPGALWSIGLRLSGSTQTDIEKAITDRQIIRTWPMRGTLHFVAATDIRWMLELLTPKIISGSKARDRNLELTEEIYRQSGEIFADALQGDKQLSRSDMLALLERNGITTTGQRGYHILWRLSQEGLLCFAAHEGKQPTFALLSDWAPTAKSLPKEEALATLAQRFFASHGPATIQDLARWSGLNLTDARAGLEAVKGSLVSEVINDVTYWLPPNPVVDSGVDAYLLPGFDEYMLGYKDRSAALDVVHAHKIVPGGNGIFLPTIVVDGQVVGLWKKTTNTKSVKISLLPFEDFTTKQLEDIKKAASRYGDFIGLPVTSIKP